MDCRGFTVSKILGIGLGRTGTTSLADALRVLGYSVVHCPRSLDQIDKHEASNDLTVASRFKELDQKYPGSKFILTLRNYDSWMASCLWHYRKHWGVDKFPEPARRFVMDSEHKIYGASAGPKIQPVDIMDGALRHLESVLLYFRDRMSDLLIMDIARGDGWERLCSFLGKPVPAEPFPHSNKRK